MHIVHAVVAVVQQMSVEPPSYPPDYSGPRAKRCPFLSGAIHKDTIWFGALKDTNPLDVAIKMMGLSAQFQALEPVNDLVNRSAVILLPNFRRDPDHDFMTEIRRWLSVEHYLPRGLMLALFDMALEDSIDGSVRELSFFVVRNMVLQDNEFLNKESDPEWREAALAAYQRLFGTAP
jgi:hypothetical protein